MKRAIVYIRPYWRRLLLVIGLSLLACFGNVLYLVGTIVMLIWLDARLFLASVALLPLSIWVLSKYRRALETKIAVMRQSSADIGSFLIETLQGMKLVVTSNSQE